MEEIEQHCRKFLSPNTNNDSYILSNEIRQRIKGIDHLWRCDISNKQSLYK